MNDAPHPTQPSKPGTPWEVWPTMGFTLLLVIVMVGVQLMIMKLFFMSAPRWAENIGLAQAVAILAVTPIAVMLCILFCRLRDGITVADYLGWHGVDRWTLLKWLGGLVLLVAVVDVVTWFTQGYIVHEFILEAYRTVRIPALGWLAVVVGAPLYEEFIFRGFMFEGLRHAAPGPVGAIVITSVLWTLLHMQYDTYALGVVLVIGLFLGAARVLTGSLMLTVLLHALLNLASMVQLLVYLWWSGTP